ncbi:serpin B [Anaerotaenia torta]|uniref:serpin family protein n=1 Tax=Anaerotaenia torta TaxID=433293 RepID=UPI003D1FB702
MKNIKKVFICLLMASVIFTGCTANNNAAVHLVSVKNVKELRAPVYGEQSAFATVVSKGANEFAFQLSAALSERARDNNFICSPYSVWLPLAALVNAADEASKPLLLEALGAAGIGEEDINLAASRMLFDLTNQRDRQDMGEGYHNPLRIANIIFADNQVKIKKDFAQTFMDYYRGSVMNVDFDSPKAVDTVNRWASDNTDGLIAEIVQKFDSSTVAAIANAIYFSDRWQWEFNTDNTKEDVFYSPAKESQAYFMLREGNNQTYYEDDRVQAMPLRFKTGGGMYIILPKDGDAAGLLASMTREYFDEIQKDAISATGKLLLPRFSVESDVMQLKDTLTALGVPLFDSEAAPLTGGLLENTMPVWLSGAVQKAAIKVDEKGTTAAAVTVMLAAGTAMPEPSEPFEMNCNRPFVFILYGDTYDGGSQILFTGMVNQP